MSRPPLACTVRACGLALERDGRTWKCRAGHSYDVARNGYVNLLQPQDRQSLSAGDSKASVEARARLIGAGVGLAIVDGVVRRAAALELPTGAVVVDLGSGSGEVLGASARAGDTAVGLDLSTAAAGHAARRFPQITWVVANADRRLPLLDRSVDLVLSVHGRRNPVECARVLKTSGRLLVAVPAADDLIELRGLVQGEREERDRAATVVAEHAGRFALADRVTLRERRTLGRDALVDLLRGTYRGKRLGAAGRVAALTTLEVTLAAELLLFAPSG